MGAEQTPLIVQPRAMRAAQHMPNWMGSIRFRIAFLYSVILFGLAAVVVATIYVGLSRALDSQPISNDVQGEAMFVNGRLVQIQVDVAQVIERRANERALNTLREYAFGSLLGLFVASILVGWFVSGEIVKPIDRITNVARQIQATDLSQRINLAGPDDELKQLADTFDEMLERIDEAFESQRDFIHEASHELRNPLAVIRTNLDVTLADPDATVDDLRRTAEIVQKSSERMGRLVDDLLIYARKGSLSLEHERIDVSTIVGEAADEFSASAEAKDIELVALSEPALWVDGDRLALRQAVANLLANAIRLSPEHTTIRVTGGRQEPWVWLGVEDQGPGIAPEDQDRVFQRFWRGNKREGREQGRSGLGLTIVRQIAEAHGGQVKLVSDRGQGAAFAVWLPARQAPEVVEPATQPTREQPLPVTSVGEPGPPVDEA